MKKALGILLCVLLVACGAQTNKSETAVTYGTTPIVQENPPDISAEEWYKGIRPPIGFKSQELPACRAVVSVTDIVSKDKKIVWKEHTITLCDRPVERKRRVGWGIILNSEKLAHGDLWIKYSTPNKWGVISYRMPETMQDADLLGRKGKEAFQQKIGVTSEGLPLVISLIPEDVRETFILSFIAYYNGAYEIYVWDSKKDVAEMVAGLINKKIKEYKQQNKK
ncbi:MAG: hypothetical protein HYT93_04290 [Parcubacteria group bacterium]|nr:hypothetical protein [Parcubacteria group bacterium]